MNNCGFTYHGKEVRAIHRSMADMVTLPDALSSVGFRYIGLPWNSACSPKVETDRADKDRPRIQVADYVYKSSTLPHTNVENASPIVISGVQIFKKKINININIFFCISISILNALTRPCNSAFALTKYAINPI